MFCHCLFDTHTYNKNEKTRVHGDRALNRSVSMGDTSPSYDQILYTIQHGSNNVNTEYT